MASVTRNGHRMLVVILGSGDRYADARTLLDYATGGWRWQSVALADNALAWTTGLDGQPYRLRPTERKDIFLPAWQWGLVQSARQLDAAAPLTSTLPVGTLTLTLAGRPLGSVPLAVWQGP